MGAHEGPQTAARGLGLTRQSTFCSLAPARKAMECRAASRQYSHAESSQGGGVGRLAAAASPAEAFSCCSLGGSTRNGRNISNKV